MWRLRGDCGWYTAKGAVQFHPAQDDIHLDLRLDALNLEQATLCIQYFQRRGGASVELMLGQFYDCSAARNASPKRSPRSLA